MYPAALYPDARIESSRRKIREPFQLDETMRFYSPQTNVDALTHPRVAEWLDFVKRKWKPPTVRGARARIGLFLPCTKYKPYVTSREHRSINAALLAAGWRPARAVEIPAEILALREPGEDPDIFSIAPLVRDGVVLDRFVMSEPLALVPYEHIMFFRDRQSPATSYDDPGLFEGRGSSISPERADCTAVRRADGSFTWGPAEREAYAVIHNAMSDAIAVTLKRLQPSYRALVAWTSPGLTHRSFLADNAFRAVDGLPKAKRGTNGVLPLRGALDDVPGAVELLPTRKQIDAAKAALTKRLAKEGRSTAPGSVRAVFARGDGRDTPLGLPELAAQLVKRIDKLAR